MRAEIAHCVCTSTTGGAACDIDLDEARAWTERDAIRMVESVSSENATIAESNTHATPDVATEPKPISDADRTVDSPPANISTVTVFACLTVVPIAIAAFISGGWRFGTGRKSKPHEEAAQMPVDTALANAIRQDLDTTRARNKERSKTGCISTEISRQHHNESSMFAVAVVPHETTTSGGRFRTELSYSYGTGESGDDADDEANR